jgi:hypothetical protein
MVHLLVLVATVMALFWLVRLAVAVVGWACTGAAWAGLAVVRGLLQLWRHATAPRRAPAGSNVIPFPTSRN